MSKQEEINQINKQLDKLLGKGSNDEKLVTKKRKLEAELRKSKT